MNLNCPDSKSELEKISLHGVEAFRCPKDNGIWFPKDSLRKAKDAEDNFLRWIDVNPWEHAERFSLAKDSLVCPVCLTPLYKTEYGDSGISIYICAEHHGVFLKEGSFRAIIDWMNARIEQESLIGYLKDAGIQAMEIVTGEESLRSETADFIIVAKLLAYRFLGHFPFLSSLISQLPT